MSKKFSVSSSYYHQVIKKSQSYKLRQLANVNKMITKYIKIKKKLEKELKKLK